MEKVVFADMVKVDNPTWCFELDWAMHTQTNKKEKKLR